MTGPPIKAAGGPSVATRTAEPSDATQLTACHPQGVIDAELVTPISRADAERLDKRIRLLVGSINDNLAKLDALVQQAKAGEIHKALGYASWTAYVADVFTIQVRLEREKRRELVGYLSGEGMSQRAIAETIGVDRNTVRTDLRSQVGEIHPPGSILEPRDTHDDLAEDLIAAESPDAPAESTPDPTERVAETSEHARSKPNLAPVIGLDGKRYQPKPPRRQEPSRPRRQPITDDAAGLAHELKRVANRINKLLNDDRFNRNRATIGDSLRPYDEWLAEAADRLHRAINSDGDVR